VISKKEHQQRDQEQEVECLTFRLNVGMGKWEKLLQVAVVAVAL
jgi:cell division protein FtsL